MLLSLYYQLGGKQYLSIQFLLYLCINADERCLIFINLAFSFSLSRSPIKDKKVVNQTEWKIKPKKRRMYGNIKVKILTYCAISRNDHFNVWSTFAGACYIPKWQQNKQPENCLTTEVSNESLSVVDVRLYVVPQMFKHMDIFAHKKLWIITNFRKPKEKTN